MVEIKEEVVLATARILGPESASARAIAEAERRRKNGETVAFFNAGNYILVGPPLETDNA